MIFKRNSFFLVSLLLLAVFMTACGNQNKTSQAPTQKSSFMSLFQKEEKLPAFQYEKQVAVIDISGTDINGAVMQADDNDYFLRRNETEQNNIWGCYFMDYECKSDSKNIIIYGHSLDDEPNSDRFSQLKLFLDESFWKKNKTIKLFYGGEWREYEVFSAGYADTDRDRIAIIENPSQNMLTDILNAAIQRNEIQGEVLEPTEGNILTLCTCTSNQQKRFVVTAIEV